MKRWKSLEFLLGCLGQVGDLLALRLHFLVFLLRIGLGLLEGRQRLLLPIGLGLLVLLGLSASSAGCLAFSASLALAAFLAFTSSHALAAFVASSAEVASCACLGDPGADGGLARPAW